MSLIVIATKLSHPFDDIERAPQSEVDPTTVKVDWEKWRETMTETPTKGLKRGEEIKITDGDVMKMSGKQMDDYLDWYQQTWIDDRNPKSSFFHYFPFLFNLLIVLKLLNRFSNFSHYQVYLLNPQKIRTTSNV
jgi:hypothetical protein